MSTEYKIPEHKKVVLVLVKAPDAPVDLAQVIRMLGADGFNYYRPVANMTAEPERPWGLFGCVTQTASLEEAQALKTISTEIKVVYYSVGGKLSGQEKRCLDFFVQDQLHRPPAKSAVFAHSSCFHNMLPSAELQMQLFQK